METRAQIAFTNGISWSVIYPYQSVSGQWEHYPMPRVNCIIIDYTGVDEVDGIVQRAKSGPEGFRDIERLIEALATIGCLINYPEVECVLSVP